MGYHIFYHRVNRCGSRFRRDCRNGRGNRQILVCRIRYTFCCRSDSRPAAGLAKKILPSSGVTSESCPIYILFTSFPDSLLLIPENEIRAAAKAARIYSPDVSQRCQLTYLFQDPKDSLISPRGKESGTAINDAMDASIFSTKDASPTNHTAAPTNNPMPTFK